jgi:hypothetical protein
MKSLIILSLLLPGVAWGQQHYYTVGGEPVPDPAIIADKCSQDAVLGCMGRNGMTVPPGYDGDFSRAISICSRHVLSLTTGYAGSGLTFEEKYRAACEKINAASRITDPDLDWLNRYAATLPEGK